MRRTHVRLSGRGRLASIMITVVLALVGVLALAACDSDSAGDTSTTATSLSGSEQAYAEGLANATRAVAGLGEAVASGSSGEQTAEDIRSATRDWESAIGSIDGLDLPAGLQGQRDQLVEDSRVFVDGWHEVANEYDSSAANGLLELVQMRAPILAGITSLQSAIRGGLEEAGGAAQAELESAREQLGDALSEITSLRP